MRDVDVATETIIAQPRAAVSGFAMDPDNAPQWYSNIRSVELVAWAMRRENRKDLARLKSLLESGSIR